MSRSQSRVLPTTYDWVAPITEMQELMKSSLFTNRGAGFDPHRLESNPIQYDVAKYRYHGILSPEHQQMIKNIHALPLEARASLLYFQSSPTNLSGIAQIIVEDLYDVVVDKVDMVLPSTCEVVFRFLRPHGDYVYGPSSTPSMISLDVYATKQLLSTDSYIIQRITEQIASNPSFTDSIGYVADYYPIIDILDPKYNIITALVRNLNG